MKTQFIILIILILGCSHQDKKELATNLDEFNKFLGQEKSLAFNNLVESFDSFIKSNYPDNDNHSDKIRMFLKKFSNEFLLDSLWVFQTSTNQEIFELIESSGLRREIWVYQYEDYEPNYNIFELISENKPDSTYDTVVSVMDYPMTDEILTTQTTEDSIKFAERDKELYEKYSKQLTFNIYGQYLYGLAKYNPTNDFIQEYVKVKIAAGDIAYEIMSNVLLDGVENYDEPFIKRMIATEIYYDLIKWDIQRKK